MPRIAAAATSAAAAVASSGRSRPPWARGRSGTDRSQLRSRPKPSQPRAGSWAILLRIRSRPFPDGSTLSAAACRARRRRSPYSASGSVMTPAPARSGARTFSHRVASCRSPADPRALRSGLREVRVVAQHQCLTPAGIARSAATTADRSSRAIAPSSACERGFSRSRSSAGNGGVVFRRIWAGRRSGRFAAELWPHSLNLSQKRRRCDIRCPATASQT
jgi:hypothetical protein